MINVDMRLYPFYTYGADDAYGQARLSESAQGSIKMAIYTITQSVADSIRYKDSTYIGLTSAPVDDSYVIEYGAEKLKVLYVAPKGRLKQVFMKNI